MFKNCLRGVRKKRRGRREFGGITPWLLGDRRPLHSLIIRWLCDDVSELFPCSSCEEIKKLNPYARSGLYVIKSSEWSDGQTLEQASV